MRDAFDRAQQARAANMATAAGIGESFTGELLGGYRAQRTGSSGGGAGGPVDVNVVSGQEEFFTALSRVFGLTNSGDAAGGGGAMGGQGGGFQAILHDQQAIAAASRQVITDLRTAATMLTQYQAESARTLSAHTEAMRVAREAEAQHMSDLLGMLTDTAATHQGVAENLAAMTGGWAGSGGGAPWAGWGAGPGGHPGGGGGGPSRSGGPGGHGGFHGAAGGHYGHGWSGLRAMWAGRVHGVWGSGGTASVNPRYDRDGNLSHYQVSPASGGPSYRVESDSPEAQILLGDAARGAQVSGHAARWASGGLRGLVRGAPIIGPGLMAGEAINSGAEWLTNQREKNTFYQQIYDQGQLQALGGRIGEEGYVLSNRFGLGGLPEGQARQLYRGVAALGFQPQTVSTAGGFSPNAAIQFGERNYRDLGMSVADSLNLITTAATHSNTSLGAVSESLVRISQTARTTGESAEVARQAFIKTFQATTMAGVTGPGAAGTAEALTAAGPGLGRDFQTMDVSGVMSPGNVYRMAGITGQTPGQLLSRSSRDPTVVPRAFDAEVRQITAAYLTPDLERSMAAEIQKRGGADKVANSPGAQEEIAQQLLAQIPNPYALQQAISATGAQVDSPQQAVQWFLQHQLTGGATGAAGRQREAMRQRSKDADTYTAPNTDLQVIDYAQAGAQALNPFDNVASFDYAGASNFVKSQWGLFNGTNHGVLSTYANYQEKTGTSDPAIENLIKDPASTDASTGIRVSTKDGDKVVSIQDAIKYYPEEIATGRAKFEGGVHDGKSVTDVTGGEEPGYQSKGGYAQDSSTQGAPAGVDPAQWAKDHPRAPGAGGGKVTVEPTAELRRWLVFIGANDPSVERGAATGTAPTPGKAPP